MARPRRTASPDSSSAAIAAERARLGEAEAEGAAKATSLAEAQHELAALESSGAPPAARRAVGKRIATLTTERRRSLAMVETSRAEIERLRDLDVRAEGPEQRVARLDGQVPIALLPVRLETRFTAGGRRLQIRVFPEPIHKDDHEREVTEQELAAAQEYWRARWAAASDPEQAHAAWQRLAAQLRPPRARWLVIVTTPTNIADLGQGEPRLPDVPKRAAAWTRAARAGLLPERWLALGFRGGREVFRKWGGQIAEQLAMGPAPDLDGTVAPPADPEALPIDDGIRWLVDYNEAERLGMAITVADADVQTGGLAAGLDLLVVAGVDWSLDPVAGAAALSEHLAGHANEDGLAFMPVGTPTNNTAEGAAGTGSDTARDAALLDPAVAPPTLSPDSAGARAERALGLGPGSPLSIAPGASHDDLGARHMANALWAPTWGYFFDQMLRPLVSDAAAADVREHFRTNVRGRGPLPTLRVGNQPYGLLPVVAPGAWSGDTPIEQEIGDRLRGLRTFWQQAASSVPELGRGGQPDRDLVTLLRMTPRSASFRLRRATGAVVVSAGRGYELLAPFQEAAAKVILGLVDVPGRPRLVDVTLDEAHRLVPVPLVVRGRPSDTALLDPNYIAEIAAALTRVRGFRALVAPPAEANSLLEALLRHAAQLEVAEAATGLVVVFELQQGILPAEPRLARVRERELHGIDPNETVRRPFPDDGESSLLDTVGGGIELAELPVREISGNRTLADHLALRTIRDLREVAATRSLGEFRASLTHLANLPQAELGRLAAETLDCASHRLDAWFTSLATSRLARVRETVAGTYIGGFGWVEDLRPRAGAGSLGHVHAPSVPQAASAAILRSGHLGRRGDDAGALALDLSSERVARALEVLEGMRQGQPIGALLGYRLERAVRDRRVTLARYILALRQAAPLATSTDGFTDNRPLEVIAARDVVDGVKLLDSWRRNPAAFFQNTPGLPQSGADRNDLQAELERLDDLLDAVSDLLLAEGVHQMVAGNDERAGAALDALDRQTAIPDAGVAHTPRTGSSVSHRLLLALHDDRVSPGWTADARGAAEPRLNAWVARVLGSPSAVRFAGVARSAEGAELQRVQATLAELAMSPLGAVLAAAGPGGSEHSSELEARLALVLAAKVTAAAAASLELLPDPPLGGPAGSIGLAELLALAREVLDLAASSRPAGPADFVLDSELRDPGLELGFDTPELKRRADAAVRALAGVLSGLPAAGTNAAPAAVIRRLLAAADVGIRSAVPASDDPAALADQVELVRSTATATLEAVRATEDGFDRGAASAAASVAHDLGRLRAVLGESFPAASLVQATNAGALAASLADATALLGGDALSPISWLIQHGLVRPAAGRLANVLSAAELFGRDIGADQLQIVQLPHRPGDRWIALPGERPAGSLSLVIHTLGGFRPANPVSAWLVDAWQDVVPSASETTGISFHFESPGARAPQGLLLAVPPSATAAAWSVETLADTIREALSLARIRAVDVDSLTAVPRFLPAIYLAFNLERKTPSLDFAELIGHAITLDNQAFALESGGGPA
jgi:hypothetical protein